MTSQRAHALIAHAHAAATTADHATTLVLTTTTPMSAHQRITAARHLLTLAHTVLDRAVITARTEHTTWALIAHALALPEHETVRRYQPTTDLWALYDLDPTPPHPASPPALWPGSLVDADPAATAAHLDTWATAHAGHPGAVSPVLP